MTCCHLRGTIVALIACAAVGLAIAQTKPAEPPVESERTVKEAEVPKAALVMLKKLAGAAAITEFAEEIEHGHTFYEGSWKGPHGNVDALVTASGDLVEIEESVATDSVAGAARTAAQAVAGNGVKLQFEKKTMILFEVHYQKEGKTHELILTPDGRTHHEESGDGPHEDQQD